MQYIKKQNTETANWNNWFTVPPNRRSYDYGDDYKSLPYLRFAKAFLIEEQHGLCAYCQQKITIDNASIEHVTPKEHNKELSTNYFNLVAVCKKQQVPDPVTGKLHCDSTRGSKLLAPIIFYSNAKSTNDRINKYFDARPDGEIIAKEALDADTLKHVDAFINILNLNHNNLKARRAKDTLRGIIEAYNCLPKGSHQKGIFWQMKYENILRNQKHEFREYLLIFIGKKIGKN